MSEFGDYLIDSMREFGPVTVKRMFGGQGVFHDGLMIGLVADDVLYLKVDPATEGEFKALDLPQFGYQKGEKRVGMSYYQAPESVFDDPEEMCLWAEKAYAAALRAKKKK